MIVSLLMLLLASATPSPASVGHESAVIDYLRPALKYVGGAARIYYAGECRAAEYDTSGKLQLVFPALYLQQPSQGATGVDAVRQIFRADPNVTVMQDRSGMVRITVGSASTAVLQTKIRALILSSRQQYSAEAALLAISTAPEVLAAERSLRLGVPFTAFSIIEGGAVEGAAHLSSSMQNVTVDEALDSVVRTFKGIVMYGICKQPDGKDLFEINYMSGS